MAAASIGTRTAVAARSTTDRVLLREFLERDRLFAVYAICDLGDREFSRTRGGIAMAGDEPVAVGMEYSGLTPQPMVVMGEPAGIAAILRDVVRPRAAYVAAKADTLAAVAQDELPVLPVHIDCEGGTVWVGGDVSACIHGEVEL